jgi:hypothetical protein
MLCVSSCNITLLTVVLTVACYPKQVSTHGSRQTALARETTGTDVEQRGESGVDGTTIASFSSGLVYRSTRGLVVTAVTWETGHTSTGKA